MDCDIGFSVTLRKDGRTEKQEVLPSRRVNSHLVFEEGMHECQHTATCKCLDYRHMHLNILISIKAWYLAGPTLKCTGVTLVGLSKL